jgi:hypothetical protein
VIARLQAAPTTPAETSDLNRDALPVFLLREAARELRSVDSVEPVLSLTDACGVAPEALYDDLAFAGVQELRGKSCDRASRVSMRVLGRHCRTRPCSSCPAT